MPYFLCFHLGNLLNPNASWSDVALGATMRSLIVCMRFGCAFLLLLLLLYGLLKQCESWETAVSVTIILLFVAFNLQMLCSVVTVTVRTYFWLLLEFTSEFSLHFALRWDFVDCILLREFADSTQRGTTKSFLIKRYVFYGRSYPICSFGWIFYYFDSFHMGWLFAILDVLQLYAAFWNCCK